MGFVFQLEVAMRFLIGPFLNELNLPIPLRRANPSIFSSRGGRADRWTILGFF